jgi:hypothetical protein
MPPDRTLTLDALTRALAVQDLTDPLQGPHALPRLLTAIHEALAARWHCQRSVYRTSPLVSVKERAWSWPTRDTRPAHTCEQRLSLLGHRCLLVTLQHSCPRRS